LSARAQPADQAETAAAQWSAPPPLGADDQPGGEIQVARLDPEVGNPGIDVTGPIEPLPVGADPLGANGEPGGTQFGDPLPLAEEVDGALAVPGIAAIPRRRPNPPPRRAASTTNPSATRSVAAAQPAAAAPTATAAPSGWGVQVSSQRSEADARKSYADLQARYPSLLSGVSPMIYPANVPGKGRFYRVRLAANSRGDAAALCQRLKSAGADCFIGRN
ncbi:MAG: SPOR domain-containing protein, partial [Pseudomonadota bacterium]